MIVIIAVGIWLLKSSLTWGEFKLTLKPVYIIPSLLLNSGLGVNFYDRWENSSWVSVIAAHIGIKGALLVLVCCMAVCVVAAVPMVSGSLALFHKALGKETGNSSYLSKGIGQTSFSKQDRSKRVSLKMAFIILAALNMLGICAILRANFNYIDDMGRAAEGYKGWDNFSRFLSTALSNIIHADIYLTDISPLTQIIAVLIIAVSGTLLLYIVYDRTWFSVWELAALIPLGLNPYFLEYLSYKFDAPYMALSVLAAIVPLLYRKSNLVIYIAISMIGSVVVCTTYQAATGIFPMLVISLAVKMWANKAQSDQIVRFIICSVIGWLSGLVVFKIIILNPIDSYVSSSMLGITELFPGIFKNLIRYYEHILTDFKKIWLFLIILLAIGYVWTTVYASKQKRYLTCIVTSLSLILMFSICFGLYPALQTPSAAPRAMYGFGVLIAILAVNIMEKQGNIIFKSTSILISWIFFVFAFTYGNSLYIQKEYTDFRINMVIEDLNDIDVFVSDDPVLFQITGTIGHSPVIENMSQNYQMINRLIPVTFRGEWRWGSYGFYNYYGLRNLIYDYNLDLTTYDLPILEDKMYHTIRGKDHYILVELK